MATRPPTATRIAVEGMTIDRNASVSPKAKTKARHGAQPAFAETKSTMCPRIVSTQCSASAAGAA